jgi:hypothetical protein
METTKDVHEISANLFFLLAFIYVVAALAFRNGYMASEAIFLMRLLDIPFAFIALLYGGTGLHLQLSEGKEEESAWGIIIFAVSIILFGAVVFVNFAFPSQL